MVAGSAEGSDGQAAMGQGMGMFEMPADNDYMYIYKYRACNFPAQGSRHAARQRGLS